MAQVQPTAGLAEINEMDQAAFVDLLGGVFEHSPWVAEEAWFGRPFASIDDLHRAMAEAVEIADDDKKLALLRAHPELAGREAAAGTLTASSTVEQSGAGLGQLSPQEAARIRALNAAYRERFGFPFIIAARHHTKESILNELERRVGNDPATELANNLQEIRTITRLRLDGVVADDDGPAFSATGTSPGT